MKRGTRNTAAGLLIGALFSGGATVGEKTLDIAGRRQLFADPRLVERFDGAAERRLHRPTMQEVVMVHDRPWEGNTCGYSTVFRDGKRYRMYYRGWNHEKRPTHPPFTCYAESPDGIRWTRPDLGIVAFADSGKNNIIRQGPGAHNFTPFRDANPGCAADARYKAVGGIGTPGLFAFTSADGIHWQRIGEKPVITAGKFDSQNAAFWDAVRGEYRVYFRDFRKGVRDIKTAVSDDFVHWSEPVWLSYPGAPREHLYTNQVMPYYRAPHLFIGFPTRYLPDRGSLVEGLFMTSTDGRIFHRWPEALIRPGRNRDRWQNRSNYIWRGLVETASAVPGGGTELSLYTNERYYRGGGVKTRRYTCRIDGFVSVRAPLAGGTALTRPLTFTGEELTINYSTAAAGAVRAAIRDAGGAPIDGFRLADCPAIYGDEIERTVRWKKDPDLGDLRGRPVRLLLEVKDADVYAFQFK